MIRNGQDHANRNPHRETGDRSSRRSSLGNWNRWPGYELEAFYKPLREVGGDYFDVIDLPANRTLFALADVSGKGIPAALLAANMQALVRSIASVESSPLALANQINKHLYRYTPRIALPRPCSLCSAAIRGN